MMMRVDIKIEGGTVLDPERGFFGVGEVLIEGSRIVAAGTGEPVEAEKVIRAEGCLVLPGLIDFHAHLFSGGSELGVAPDLSLLPQGVTTAVDAGSCGTANFEAFMRFIVPANRVRLFSLLNVCPVGLATTRYHEQVDPRFFDEQKMGELLDQYPGQLLGLKVRQSKDIVGELGLKPLQATVEIAGRLGCPVVVHTTNPPTEVEQISALLRPGDVFCHVHHGAGETILDAAGKVKQAMVTAQKAGVVFDAANGRNNFSFGVAKQAISEGFFPDVISSDVTAKTNYSDYVFGLPYIMMKYLALGMNLEQVVAACTATPAKWLGMSGKIGTLKPGAFADVAIFRQSTKPISMKDTYNKVTMSEGCLAPQLTILGGKVVYRQIDF
jgi:predicted amidohydrolase